MAEGRALQIDRSGLFFTAFLPNIQILDCKIGKNYPRWGQFSLCAPSATQAPGVLVWGARFKHFVPSAQVEYAPEAIKCIALDCPVMHAFTLAADLHDALKSDW